MEMQLQEGYPHIQNYIEYALGNPCVHSEQPYHQSVANQFMASTIQSRMTDFKLVQLHDEFEVP